MPLNSMGYTLCHIVIVLLGPVRFSHTIFVKMKDKKALVLFHVHRKWHYTACLFHYMGDFQKEN